MRQYENAKAGTQRQPRGLRLGLKCSRLLVLKVVGVLAVAGLGWRNWKRLTPRLDELGSKPLHRSTAGELALAALVLAITSALVITPPPAAHP